MGILDKYETADIDWTAGKDGLSIAKQKLVKRLNWQIELLSNSEAKDHRGKPISQWWFRHTDGEIYTHIRFGTRPIEFANGKAFKVGSVDALEAFYKDVIEAVHKGELDEDLEKARKVGIRGHRRRGRRGHHRRRQDADED